MSRWVLHVDLDQFIAAVEVLAHPELRGRPVIVGGDGDPAKRGVVSTASYEARAYGVHSGMPLRTAARRCPDAVFRPVDRDAYVAASARVMAALNEVDSVVEVLGWDEAFLGVETDDPETVAHDVQARVRRATQLDCSVGIGRNRLQAKLATGFGKPAGVFRLTHRNWFVVLGEQPPDALWGIGAKTAKRLAGLDIHTVAQLAGADPDTLAAALGPTIGPWLARSVADDIAAEHRPVSRIVVKVRYAPFLTHTHGHPLAAPTLDPAEIEAGAYTALERFTDRRPVRLLGVRGEFGDRSSPRARSG